MDTLSTLFADLIEQVMAKVKPTTLITEDNVYQEGNEKILPFFEKMIDTLVLPGSGVNGMENLEELYKKALSGASCLLLPEHYSNLDLTLITSLIGREGGLGPEIAKSVVAIAGMKLNEENPIVSAFASAYSRIIIYPSRSMEKIDREKDQAERSRSNAINRAAIKALNEIKTKGHLILVFPSGTRYRPWDPNTKRGLREVDSYIRSFDYMCPIAINGEVLHVRQGDMLEDSVSRHIVRITAGSVIPCSEFRNRIKAEKVLEDKKQAVADAIMEILEEMHKANDE